MGVSTPTSRGRIVGSLGGRASDSRESLNGVFSITSCVHFGRFCRRFATGNTSLLLFCLAVSDEKRIVVFRERQRRGIPPRRNKSDDCTVAAYRNPDHGNRVV